MADPRLFPLRPDWSSGVTDRIEFATNVFVSDNGTEERRAARAEPRLRRQIGGWEKARGARAVLDRLRVRAGERFVLRDPWLQAKLSGAVAGDQVLTVTAAPAWLSEAAVLVLDVSGREFTVEPTSVSVQNDTTTIALAEPLDVDVPGGSFAYAGFVGFIDDRINVTARTSDVVALGVTMLGEVGRNVLPDAGLEGETFQGLEVFPFRANWAQPIRRSFNPVMRRADFGYGRFTRTPDYDWVPQSVRATYLGRDRDGVDSIIGFFMRHKGRLKPFWKGSDTDDFEMAVAAPAGAQLITVRGETAGLYLDDPAHRYVVWDLYDGSRVYGELTGAVVQSNTTVLGLKDPLPRAIDPDDVRRFTWLEMTRFGADELTVDWITTEVGEVAAAFQNLRIPGEETL